MNDEHIRRTYETLWPEADRIRRFAYRCGAPRRAINAADYLGFDLLNGGLREVWALADNLRVNRESKLLDLGCGLGGPTRFIAERFDCFVVGIDITMRQLSIARALTKGLHVAKKVRFIRGDAQCLPFSSHTFDGVYSMEAFVHFRDKDATIREAFRVLRPGGVFCVHDPVHDPKLQIAYLENTLHPKPVEEYRGLLRDAGFGEIHILDRTVQSLEAYTLLSEFMSVGSISPWKARAAFRQLHPNIGTSLWRSLSLGRIHHTFRYILNRNAAALDLLGNSTRCDGVKRMCNDIVAGYRNGSIRFFQVIAVKPSGAPRSS